jgi:hypothetical protein
MQTCRPEIKEDSIRKIKMKYPETALMSITQTIEFAIQKAIEKKN